MFFYFFFRRNVIFFCRDIGGIGQPAKFSTTYMSFISNDFLCCGTINIMDAVISESAPFAYIARFGDWHNAKQFEMAYNPAPGDSLRYNLSSQYKPGPYTVPFANGGYQRFYGTNTIPVECTMYSDAAVNACKHQNPRAPGQLWGDSVRRK